MSAFARWGAFWLLVALAAGLWGYSNDPGRIEAAFIDHLSAMNGRPAPDDIVIVAIDDRSLAALGRWPWRRSLHAVVVERLREARAKAIGLDLVMSEPDAAHPRDDALLADAMRRAGNVVLPLHMQRLGGAAPQEALPAPVLAAAARDLGHIHVELGSDGVARSVFLREGLIGGPSRKHWAIALMQAANESLPDARLPGARRPAGDAVPGPAAAWQRDHWMQIPFAGPPGHFRRVSYIDVLEGRVPAQELHGKVVLVGATAVGMGDSYLTPIASEDSLMPGVEISANVLDALRRGVELRLAEPWENALFCLVPVVLAMLALYRLRPRWAFCSVIALMLAVYTAAWLAQRAPGIQFAPLAALRCLALVYPLWSWLRLEAAINYLSTELRGVQKDGQLLTAVTAPVQSAGDELDRRMLAMTHAVEQLRGLQRFVRETLDGLSDAVLVLDAKGRVLLVNRAAARYFGAAGEVLQERPADEFLAGRFSLPGGLSWPVRQTLSSSEVAEIHVRDAQQRDLLLKCVPRRGPSGEPAGCIVCLVNITTVQQAQRQREEALRFLSHDMRAPQSSILTLIELHRLDAVREPQLFDRIEAHARRTLALADDFVHLARAQSDAYEFQPLDVGDAVIDAVDRFWDQARARGVEIVTQAPAGECWARADRELLTRAVGNLIDNALKYGSEGGRVQCSLALRDGRCVIRVRDDGPGIAEEHQAGLFDEFKRLGHDTRTSGAGLGLAFVQAVVVRHRGSFGVTSRPGCGAEFHIELPALDVPVQAAALPC